MIKRAIRPEDPVIIYLISLLLCQIGGVILASSLPTDGEAYIFLAYAIPQAVYIITTAIYFAATKTEFRFLPKRSYLKPLHYGVAIILGLGLFFGMLLPNYGVQLLFNLIGKAPTVTLPLMNTPGTAVLGLFVICVLPAIGEELVFRKAFCDGFASFGRIAVLLSGLIFSLSHLNLAQTVHQFFLGCILAYLYMKTGNITLTVIIHFLNNALVLFLPAVTGNEIWQNMTVLAVCCAVGLAIAALSVLYFVKKTPPLNAEKKAKPSPFVIGFIVIMVVLWGVSAAMV